MQDDITWGVQYLIEQGIADPQRVAIMGGSYGGYATLAGLAFTPDLYACGVDIVGPSNLFTLLDSVPPYWEAARAFLHGMVGDPATEEGQELIHNASPLFRADQIKRPLLIVQGANDPRVKQAEADQIVIALRDRGHDVSYLLAEDEGHGFAKPVNNMAMYAEIERFLAEKLGGRYQEEMPDDVAARLEQLRVDILTVSYTPPSEVRIAAALPQSYLKVAPGVETWDVVMEVQGQELQMTLKREFVREADGWTITDRTSTPFGEMIDVGAYSATLHPLSRELRQGPQTVSAKYTDNSIQVDIDGSSQTLAYQGAILCEGPARNCLITSLALDKLEGTVVNVADLSSMKVGSWRLQVTGQELLDGVPFIRVDIESVENAAVKAAYWLDPQSKQVQRVRQIVPALGNAIMTMKRQQ